MTGRQSILLALAVALSAPGISWLIWREPDHTTTATLVSDPYRLDKIYRSMQGPMSIASNIRVANNGDRCPVQWITGVEAEVVDAEKQTRVSQEFFCHSNLTFAEHSGTPDRYNRELGGKTHLDWRLFTLAPGRLSIQLPPGFGVPVPADAPLDYVTMSLNLNAHDEPVNVRMRTKLQTIAGDQPGAPTKALFRRALYVLDSHGITSDMGPSCNMQSMTQHIGAACGEMSKISLVNNKGESLMNHWIVPPGHHIYKTDITRQLNLPFDTTVHYATIHVHPFARAMELRDLTTGKVVFHLTSRDWSDRIGVAHVDEFKSTEGVPIFRDHRYELTAEYDNTSVANTDAMAILYVYLLEKNLI
jgi:hypothetical protein